MFTITKKLAIAASIMALYSGQFVAFASDNEKGVDGIEPSLPMHAIVQAPALKTFGRVVKPNKIQIFTLAASDENTAPGNLRLVCREWRDIIDGLINKEDKNRKYVDQHPIWQKLIRVAYGGLGHDADWNTIFNGELVYKPNPDSDVGMKRLKISDLPNPFAGSFDLSGCGDADKYLSISMGLRKGKKDSSKDKSEIWLIPRFLAMQKLEGSASYLKGTMGRWSAEIPMAVIFNWWCNSNDTYAFCYWADNAALMKTNLRAIYGDEKTCAREGVSTRRGRGRVAYIIGSGALHAAISCFVFKLT